MALYFLENKATAFVCEEHYESPGETRAAAAALQKRKGKKVAILKTPPEIPIPPLPDEVNSASESTSPLFSAQPQQPQPQSR
jgi:hypothetical protein